MFPLTLIGALIGKTLADRNAKNAKGTTPLQGFSATGNYKKGVFDYGNGNVYNHPVNQAQQAPPAAQTIPLYGNPNLQGTPLSHPGWNNLYNGVRSPQALQGVQGGKPAYPWDSPMQGDNGLQSQLLRSYLQSQNNN